MWPDDETPEPAAWINFNAATSERNVSFVCESELASIPLWPEPPSGQRKPLPLSDDEIKCIKPVCADFVSFRAGVRHAERAHGIGGEHG
jgi:hypothetical protein